MSALLCVLVRAFRLELIRRDCGLAPDRAAVLSDKPDRGRIIETDAAAHEQGARVGHTVLQARAAAESVHVLVHDAQRSHAVWSDMLDALDAVCPLIEDGGEGVAYLDMRGVAGDTLQWAHRVRRVLHGFELPVRCAGGPNKFIAFVRAHAGSERIDAVPIAVLGIEPRTLERLHVLGIRTLGDLAALPHGPLVRRFGKDAAVWHERARGIDPTPFRPRAHEVHIDASAYGEGSAEQEEQVVFALRVLADRVCNDLQRAGKAAAQVCARFECENGDVRDVDTGFAQPTADSRTMIDVLRAKLEGNKFEAPITGLRLQVMRLEECGTSTALFGQNQPDPQTIAVAMARLHAATGSVPHCARTWAAACLEERFAFDAFTVKEALNARMSPLQEKPGNTAAPQLRLLAVREIDVRTRGTAPVSVQSKRVLECAGPWRVDDGWFDTPTVRDEYDVLLEDGLLCRIYHQGSHWYLRGAYD